MVGSRRLSARAARSGWAGLASHPTARVAAHPPIAQVGSAAAPLSLVIKGGAGEVVLAGAMRPPALIPPAIHRGAHGESKRDVMHSPTHARGASLWACVQASLGAGAIRRLKIKDTQPTPLEPCRPCMRPVCCASCSLFILPVLLRHSRAENAMRL